jgi:hypothetical protein
MNAEDFIMYSILLIVAAAGGAYLLFDAWRDRRDAACEYGLPK